LDGVRKTYDAFINPGEIPVGYAFLATKHATETHLVPLPPNGFGSESDNLEILNIILFLMRKDRNETKPLDMHPGDINAVESTLWQLHEHPGPYMNAGRGMFCVHLVSTLFHKPRNASMGVPKAVILPHNFLAEHGLITDTLEFKTATVY
jgi:hypothetical protein